MNHTPKKTPQPPSAPVSGKKPWPTRLFAVGAVLLLVVAGLVVVISGLMSGGTGRDPAQEQSAYTAQTMDRLGTLGDLESALRGRDLPVDTGVGDAEVAALARELDGVQARLQAALREADALPALPEGYVPGSDIGLDVPDAVAIPYDLPAFQDRLQAVAYEAAAVAGQASPVANRTGVHLPKTGVATVDEALGQLVGACAALRDAIAEYGTSVPAVPVPTPGVPADPCAIQGLDELPIQDPTGLAGGLEDPTGGLLDDLTGGVVPPGVIPVPGSLLPGGVGSPSGHVRDANDAVDPDELGAMAAQLHAGEVIGATGGAYDQATASLTALLESYDGLALQLQDLLDKAQAEADAATESLPKELQARLTEVAARADALRADAERLAGDLERTARSAGDEAQAAAQDAVASHTAALQTRLDGEVGRLNAEASRIVSTVESRKETIEGVVASAETELTRLSRLSGIDPTAQLAAIQAAGAAAVASLDAQAKARVESLKQDAAMMQANAQAAVPRMAGMGVRALASANDTVEDALGRAGAARTYLTDFATAQAEKAVALEERLQADALALLEGKLAEHQAQLKAVATAMTESVPDVIGHTALLVGTATDLVETEVGKDITYIAEVASDYSKVPTEERKARAFFWSTVSSLDRQAVEEIGVAGDGLMELAEMVVAAAEQAEGEVALVAA